MPAKPAPTKKPKALKPRIESLSKRRARNREMMINTIIECARDIMRENGVPTLNMQILAKTVGIQAPSLYEYFENKNAIFDALYELGLDIFQSNVFSLIKESDDFPTVVRSIFAAELDFSRKHPDLYQIVFNNALPGYVISEKNKDKVRDGLNRGVEVIRGLIQKEKYKLPISAEQAALLVDIVVSGVATRLINLEADKPDEFRSQYESLVDAMIALLSPTGKS